MSSKHAQHAVLIARYQGRDQPAHYLAFFDCFNRGLFYEAHDVLEELWLRERRGPDGDFYKGLIQLAGAFVHARRGRVSPAKALLRLARGYLEKYPDRHRRLNVIQVCVLIEEWLERFHPDGAAPTVRPEEAAPQIRLE